MIGYLPSIPKVHYMAVCRATGRIPRAAAVLTVAAAMEVTAAAIGGASGGLKGLSFALLAVFIVEGLVTTPSVIRAAIGGGRHRRADSSTAASSNRAYNAQRLEKPSRSYSLEQVRPRYSHSRTIDVPGTKHEPITSARTLPLRYRNDGLPGTDSRQRPRSAGGGNCRLAINRERPNCAVIRSVDKRDST